MFISLYILIIFAVRRLLVPEHFDMDAAFIGIPLMVLAGIADSYHWQKNYRRAQKNPTPIMEAQWRLRRAKTFSDVLILLALVLSVLLVRYSWAEYIDPAFSFIVIGFLLLAGYREISSSLPDLFDQTLEEELQLVILHELSSSFHRYHDFHGVRSRRSGSTIYIEIFLGFDPEQRMREVQEFTDSLKGSLEARIPGVLSASSQRAKKTPFFQPSDERTECTVLRPRSKPALPPMRFRAGYTLRRCCTLNCRSGSAGFYPFPDK